MALRSDCAFHEKDIATEPVRCVSNGTLFNWMMTSTTHCGFRYFTGQTSAYSCRDLCKSDKVVCGRNRAADLGRLKRSALVSSDFQSRIQQIAMFDPNTSEIYRTLSGAVRIMVRDQQPGAGSVTALCFVRARSRLKQPDFLSGRLSKLPVLSLMTITSYPP